MTPSHPRGDGGTWREGTRSWRVGGRVIGRGRGGRVRADNGQLRRPPDRLPLDWRLCDDGRRGRRQDDGLQRSWLVNGYRAGFLRQHLCWSMRRIISWLLRGWIIRWQRSWPFGGGRDGFPRSRHRRFGIGSLMGFVFGYDDGG